MSDTKKDKFSQIYDKLLTLDVKIEEQDIAPPSYINRKIAECGQKLGDVQKLFINSNRNYTLIRRNLNIDKSELEILKRKALTSNEKIRKLPSVKEREAAVDDLYEDKHREIAENEEMLNDYQNLLSALRAQIQLLRSKNSDLKTMARMTELNITKLNNLPVDHADIRDFAKDLDNIKEVTDEIDVEDFSETVESSAEEVDTSEEDEIEVDNIDIDIENAEIEDDLVDDSAPEQNAGTNKPDGSVGNAVEVDLDDSVDLDLSTDEIAEESEGLSGDESSSDQNEEQVDGMGESNDDSVDDILEEFGSSDDGEDEPGSAEEDRDEAQQGVRISESDDVSDSDDDLDVIDPGDKDIDTIDLGDENIETSDDEESEDMLDIDLDESGSDNSETPEKEEKSSKKESTKKAQEPVDEDEASVSTDGIDVDELLDSL